MKINGHTYGEFISMDNVRIELHMSKRRLAYLLQNGYIPCEIRNSVTWRYKIRTKDVVAYIKSGISPDIPPGVFKRKPKAEVERIKFNKKKLKESFKERMSEYPDALTYDDVAKITGRARGCVCKWTSAGQLKAVKLNSNVSIVPKQWLLEFMLTDDFIYNCEQKRFVVQRVELIYLFKKPLYRWAIVRPCVDS